VTVIQFSPPRTGSTMVWQALRALGYSPSKQHEWKPEYADATVIATMRDPRDICCSMWRIERGLGVHDIELGIRMNAIEIEGCASYADVVARQYLPQWLDPAIHWLTYERFWNSLDGLLRGLEHAGIEVPADLERKVELACKLNVNRRRAAELESYLQYDPDTHIHGNHIAFPEPGAWRRCVPQKWQALYSGAVLEQFREWGLGYADPD
jgi:hypothetical protein